MSDAVRVERSGAVGIVSIDRPEVRNAIDGPTAEALESAFLELDEEAVIVATVLTGAGGTFCAGADLKAIASGRGNRVDGAAAEVILDTRGPLGPTRLQTSKPVIAAVEGHAVAGGLELACWCDLRVASTTAVFGVYCRRWGVPLVDGGTVRLPRLIGHSRAMDMILTGRGVEADEALAMGLANRVVPEGRAREAAVELAQSLAAFPQLCLRSDRRSAIEQWSLNPAEALARESALGLETIRSGETRAGAERFAADRGATGPSGADHRGSATSKVTPVRSSETPHNRAATSRSWLALLDSTRSGRPENPPNPAGP